VSCASTRSSKNTATRRSVGAAASAMLLTCTPTQRSVQESAEPQGAWHGNTPECAKSKGRLARAGVRDVHRSRQCTALANARQRHPSREVEQETLTSSGIHTRNNPRARAVLRGAAPVARSPRAAAM
jgi:hypothetical protein